VKLFDDPLFQMFAERALATMTGGGAEYGECAATAARITGGDADSWHREWAATAATVQQWAETSEERGHRVSAREGYLRATTYHRIAYYPLFGEPVDPRLTETARRERHCFARFAALLDVPLRAVEVPYESTSLSGYLCTADGTGAARPALVAVNGYDSNVHEMWWSHALPALRRGYNCLLVDGPGQGRALVEQGLRMRPDWENVLRPVLDYAVAVPEIDAGRIAVMGWSFGGFLAPRAVSGDGRVAALIADPGQWDQLDAIRGRLPLPPELLDRLPDVDPAEIDPYLAPAAEIPVLRWRLIQRGLWVHGLSSLGEYVVEMGRYTISDVAGKISCPTLITLADGDPIAAGAETLYDALSCPKTLVRFTADEGAGGHCESWNRSLLSQRVFDWLDEVLAG
jgi:pimeloyl-ACP methyl ester carboxylesterase